MLDGLVIPGWLDLLDILLVAGFAWLGIRTLRVTRARTALVGLGLLALVYVFAQRLDLRLSAAMLQSFFAVVVLVLVVVFQEDLRRLFEQLGSWRRDRDERPVESSAADLLVRAIEHLAANRTGALIIIPGREPLERHLEGGVALGGRVSEPLLLSLFDSSSPGHDGAAILRDATIERFAVHLPLSANHAAVGPGGTRHAAALGLAERCDAICIAVSEERGTVSVARDGALKVLDRPADLIDLLRASKTRDPAQESDRRRRRTIDAALALGGALAMWMIFIPGSDPSQKTLSIPVEITNLPDEFILESVDPETIEVTLRGTRRQLMLAEPEDVSLEIDAYLAQLGRRTFRTSGDQVRRPSGVDVDRVEPEKIKISLRKRGRKRPKAAAP